MQRTRQILSHGWLGRAVTVLTLGYYPATSIVGKLCIGAISFSVPGASLALTIPGMDAGMMIPGMDIEIEDCD